MTHHSARERLFRLFMKYGLVADTKVVSRRAAAATRFYRCVLSKTTHELPPEFHNFNRWLARREELIQRWVHDVQSMRENIDNYPNWAPSSEDWSRLSIKQSVAYEEPGFKFVAPPENESAARNERVYSLVQSELRALRDLGDDGNQPSLAKAAAAAVKTMNKLPSGEKRKKFGKLSKSSSVKVLVSRHHKETGAALRKEEALRKLASAALKEVQLAREAAWSQEDKAACSQANDEIGAALAKINSSHARTCELLRPAKLPRKLELWVSAADHFGTLANQASEISSFR